MKLLNRSVIKYWSYSRLYGCQRISTRMTAAAALTQPLPSNLDKASSNLGSTNVDDLPQAPISPSDVQLSTALAKDARELVLFCPAWKHLYDIKRKSVLHPEESIHLISKSDLLDWNPATELNSRNLTRYWMRLAKIRLTTLVVLTTSAGYFMACPTVDPVILGACLIGTGLTSSAAAALNQFLEQPFDSQMMRTRNRPLVMHQLSPLHSVAFAGVAATAGITLLATLVNPLTAALGATNLILYSFIYTPMKRANIINTWIGSIVGAIPPVMGVTAAVGTFDATAALLGLILYSWQFPHFNALSWNMKNDYARAGYRMMSVTNPELCKSVALRHSGLVFLYSALMPIFHVTTWTFFFDTLPLNAALIYLSWKFYEKADAQSSRKLFKYSLIHLPAIILLMILSKKSAVNEADAPIKIKTPMTSTKKLDTEGTNLTAV